MKKKFFKFNKVITSIACSPLIFISNNSELAARYLPNKVGQSLKNLEIQNKLFENSQPNNYDYTKYLKTIF